MISRAGIVDRVEAWVRELLEGEIEVAHGWPHIDRVRRTIQVLAPAEGLDLCLAECAALLHDIGRAVPGPEEEHGRRSAELAAPLLAELPLSAAERPLSITERHQILYAVRWHNSRRDDSPLLCVLRDADMLDGMGAIGLMRAFSSKAALPPYDPESPFDVTSYRRPPATIADQVCFQIDWIDFLNTDTARKLARDRIEFMRAFVAQIRQELGEAP